MVSILAPCQSIAYMNVYIYMDCVVCGFQYVGSTSTPFRLRFNNYKACYRKFRLGPSVP